MSLILIVNLTYEEGLIGIMSLSVFPFLVLLLNLLFFVNIRPTTDRFNCYFCFCCCSICSCKADIEYAVFKLEQPTQHFLLRINADGSEEICSEVNQEDQVEEAEKREQTETQPNEERDQQPSKEGHKMIKEHEDREKNGGEKEEQVHEENSQEEDIKEQDQMA